MSQEHAVMVQAVRRVAGLWACTLTLLVAQARPGYPVEPSVEYTVNLMTPQTQTMRVSMRLRGVTTPTLDVCLPVWRPGMYVVLDQAGSIRTLGARDSAGSALPCRKTDKSTWQIETGGNSEIAVDYELYVNSLGDRTRHLDDTHAFLSPASVFVYAPAFRSVPLRVKLVMPEDWSIASGLEAAKDSDSTLAACDFDRLVDSPIEVGHHERMTFEVAGKTLDVFVWWGGDLDGAQRANAGGWYSPNRIMSDFSKIVAKESELFGDLPFDRYAFLIHVYPGGHGGTEHWNSTIMQTSPGAFQSEDGYRGFLGLMSHEFFHTWNVKRLRPAGLRPYDYQHENYTDLLWVAEGTTSYYGGLMLVRTGFSKPDSQLSALGGGIENMRSIPGTRVQSAEDSSFDAWIKQSKPSPDAVNSRVNFYGAGSAASFLLDLKVRTLTENHASLDTVMRRMYEKFPETGPGYTRQNLVETASEIGGTDLRSFFDQYLSGTRAYPFEDLVGVLGLELVREPNKHPERASDAAGAQSDTDEQPYFGFSLDNADLPTVTAVMTDGPAEKAGLMVGDTLISANDLRLRAGAWDRMLKKFTPGKIVRFDLFRYDVHQSLDIASDARPDSKWTLRRVAEPSDAQKAAYESWLQQPWPAREPKSSREK